MRTLVFLFVSLFVVSLIALAYHFGQKSVDISIASLTTKSSSCLKNSEQNESSSMLTFPLIKESKAATTTPNAKKTASNAKSESPADAIDTTIIHAIRKGSWSEQDNRVFMGYIAHLNKKERISVLKQMNKAINYQQMKIGSYIPNF